MLQLEVLDIWSSKFSVLIVPYRRRILIFYGKQQKAEMKLPVPFAVKSY